MTLTDLTWENSTLLDPDDVMGAIRELKAAQEGDMQVMGCPSLAKLLSTNGLVDEYRLMIEPILLGGGKGLFPTDGEARPLELVSVVTASTGVLVCHYRPLT